ncbi:MAG: hypothetical protein ABSF23_16085 [Terracidiphilus sp.]|jgi:hypothetical protein
MRKLAVAAVLWFCVLLVAGPARAQSPVRVGGESLRANGQLAQGFQYTGSCPVELQFGWGLISDRPTEIAYTFARSDGGHQSSSTFSRLPQAGRSVPVYYTWNLGANTPRFADYSGWVKLILQAPNSLEKEIHFTLHCQ